MNILFILPRYPIEKNTSTLEKEIVEEFQKQGHTCKIMTIMETQNKSRTDIINNIEVSRIKVGDYYSTNVNKIKKGLTMLKIPIIFSKELKKYDENTDLIILSTPMMNNPYLMKKIKQNFKSKILLIVWDIFPQNGKDIKIINNKILFDFFDRKYKKSLKLADFISCMSKGNGKYLINNYEGVKEKIFILKNWSKIREKVNVSKDKIREKYDLNKNDFIAIFGGNMGKPQSLENILELAKLLKEIKDISFLFVGKGTEKSKLENLSKKNNLTNVKFLDYVPREDYEKLTASCDLGLISLDERFTVPNFPSKTTDYFKLELPILASLDSCALNDYGIFLEKEVRGGLVAKAGYVRELKEKLLKLYNDKGLRIQLGKNGRKYYEEELGVDKAYNTIMNKINGDEIDV